MSCYRRICKELLLSSFTTIHHRMGQIRSYEGTTQGDPIAMVVYSIAIIPMILMIVDISSKIDDSTKTAAYADDVTAADDVTTRIHVLQRHCNQNHN